MTIIVIYIALAMMILLGVLYAVHCVFHIGIALTCCAMGGFLILLAVDSLKDRSIKKSLRVFSVITGVIYAAIGIASFIILKGVVMI